MWKWLKDDDENLFLIFQSINIYIYIYTMNNFNVILCGYKNLNWIIVTWRTDSRMKILWIVVIENSVRRNTKSAIIIWKVYVFHSFLSKKSMKNKWYEYKRILFYFFNFRLHFITFSSSPISSVSLSSREQ